MSRKPKWTTIFHARIISIEIHFMDTTQTLCNYSLQDQLQRSYCIERHNQFPRKWVDY